jgi:hypothetical protein
MRIEKYTRKLVDGAYRVIGGSTYSSNFYNYDEYEPIKMSLSKGTFNCPTPNGGSIYDNFEELIRLAKVMSDDSGDFAENYAEIMRGNRLDWYLGGFDVFIGGISLNFANRSTREIGWVDITDAPRLWLTFETPRTRLGFIPRYNVHIVYDGENRCITTVEEDQGYLYRLIEFEPEDITGGNAGHSRDIPQYMKITEYAGM